MKDAFFQLTPDKLVLERVLLDLKIIVCEKNVEKGCRRARPNIIFVYLANHHACVISQWEWAQSVDLLN